MKDELRLLPIFAAFLPPAFGVVSPALLAVSPVPLPLIPTRATGRVLLVVVELSDDCLAATISLSLS
jgi:hypothetical protein